MSDVITMYLLVTLPLFIYTFLCGFLVVGAFAIAKVGLIMMVIPAIFYGLVRGFAWLWTKFHKTEAPAA